MGFSCGHVFHLPCLLEVSEGVDQAARKRLQGRVGSGDEASGRSVKGKVAHAQEIRRAIKNGCPVCPETEEAAS